MIYTVCKHAITGYRCEPSSKGGRMERDNAAILQQGLHGDVGGVQKNTDKSGRTMIRTGYNIECHFDTFLSSPSNFFEPSVHMIVASS